MADSKVSDLTDAGTLDGDEYLYVVDDPSGTAVSRRTTAAEVVASAFSGARVSRVTSDQPASGASHTMVEWNNEFYDHGDYHDNAVNPSRLTVPADGFYLVTSSVRFAEDAGTGELVLRWWVNESVIDSVPYRRTGATEDFEAHTISDVFALSADDYVEVGVFIGSGAGDIRAGSSAAIVRMG